MNDPLIHHSITPVPEHCYKCSVPLPPLLPNGQRRSNICIGCGTRLYPPGTTFDHCPVCEDYQAILPNGERHSEHCQSCDQKLPPPGQRFVTQCPGCGTGLRNPTADGQRLSDRCPDCRTLLPLLEPAPPPPVESNSSDPPALAA